MVCHEETSNIKEHQGTITDHQSLGNGWPAKVAQPLEALEASIDKLDMEQLGSSDIQRWCLWVSFGCRKAVFTLPSALGNVFGQVG